jgi:hypothetical protein
VPGISANEEAPLTLRAAASACSGQASRAVGAVLAIHGAFTHEPSERDQRREHETMDQRRWLCQALTILERGYWGSGGVT